MEEPSLKEVVKCCQQRLLILLWIFFSIFLHDYGSLSSLLVLSLAEVNPIKPGLVGGLVCQQCRTCSCHSYVSEGGQMPVRYFHVLNYIFLFHRYRDAGKEVLQVLSDFTDRIERASIDEAYLDLTEVVKERLGRMGSGGGKEERMTLGSLPSTWVVDGAENEEQDGDKEGEALS